jgi:hypothetical protein
MWSGEQGLLASHMTAQVPEQPQTFGVPPPPHVFGGEQGPPQLTFPVPQPLGIELQFMGGGHEVSGMQMHWRF